MKTWIRIAGVLGLFVLIGLVVEQGASSIAQALSQAGWILFLLVPFHAVPLLADTRAWHILLISQPQRPGMWSLFGVAAVREAINRLLPVANIGGEVVGIRMLALRGMDATQVAASVIVEVTLTIAAQYVFVAFGILALSRIAGADRLIESLLIGFIAGIPVVLLIIVLLRRGSLFEWLGRAVRRLIGGSLKTLAFAASLAELDQAIRDVCRPRRLFAALAWQVGGLLIGSVETWAALRWLHQPIGIPAAIALESVTQAVRHFVFLVPAGLGVQEAAFIALGSVLGVPNEAALALSLTKRMRELLFGVPALLLWQWTEARELRFDKHFKLLDPR